MIGESSSPGQVVVVDEIQRLPSLLNEVHRLIETRKCRFLLTGSSARKLRHGGANLLGGRAWQANLFPLVSREIPNFDLLRYLNRGGMPHIYLSDDFEEELREYVSLYLSEEVKSETLVRNIERFTRFLDTIALANGEEINFQNLASDTGIPARTIDSHLGILEDTMVGFRLPPFLATTKRKAITRSKFYLFDVGVVNSLANRGEIKPKSELFGRCFEHFLTCELRAYLGYTRGRQQLSYWRSTSQFEVDVIVGRELAIEFKSTDLVVDKHLKGLRALKEEGLVKRFLIVSQDERKRLTEDKIAVWPWQEFLTALWSGQLIGNGV